MTATATMDKRKALEGVLQKMKDKHPTLNIGFGAAIEYELIETPFPSLNNLIGGGFPRSKYTTVCGPEQTAKGTSLLQTIAHNQHIDPDFIALWTDAEEAFEPSWAQHLGVDLDRLIIQGYDTEHAVNAEKILQDGLDVIQTRAIDMWVIDSIAALLPKGEDEKEMDEATMMETARLMGKMFRKSVKYLKPVEEYKGCAVVMIGQVYAVPSDYAVGLTAVRGGNALKHWAHLRLVTRRGNHKEGPGTESKLLPDGRRVPVRVGWAQHIKLEKTRRNDKEGQEVLLNFYHGRGLDSINSAITCLLATDVIERSGSWFSHPLLPGGKIQGAEQLTTFLQENVEVREALVAQLDEDLDGDNDNETED